MHLAAMKGNNDIVQLLFDKGGSAVMNEADAVDLYLSDQSLYVYTCV